MAQSVVPGKTLRFGHLRAGAPALSCAAFIIVFPLVISGSYYLNVATFIVIYSILVLSITLLYGFAGQISIASAAFYGVGAYSVAFLTVHLGVSGWIAIVIGVIISSVIAYAIGRPILRLEEFYLALATLAVAEIFLILVSQTDKLGGALGIAGIPPLSLGPVVLRSMRAIFWAYGIVLLGVFLFFRGVANRRIGRALHAIRISESGAKVLGVNVDEYKARIFALSGGVAALAGGLYAHFVQYISPDSFTVEFNVTLLVMAFVGGLRSLWGALVGVIFITVMNELLRSYDQYQVMLNGFVLIVVLLLMPRGLAGGLDSIFQRLKSQPWAFRVLGSKHPQVAPIPNTDETIVEAVKEELPAGDPTQAHPKAAVVSTPRRSPVASESILVVDELSKRFGGLKALSDVTFKVQAGSITGLIGPNGSGKTTCFNVISGLLKPSSGRVLLRGQQISGLPAHKICALGVGRSFQTLNLFGERTVLENALVGAHSLGKKGITAAGLGLPGVRKEEQLLHDRAKEYLQLLRLDNFAKVRADQLSFGQQKLLTIAIALMSKPDLILLDEPAAAINPTTIQFLMELIRKVNDEANTTFLVVEHNMEVIMQLCDEVVVLDHGHRIAEGSPEAIRRNPAVLDAYLGS